MVENHFYIDIEYSMRVNFNLKAVGKKSQIWLTTTINKQRARVFTKLLIEPQHWLKTTRTQIGEKATEDPAIGAVLLRYNKGVNKELKRILDYCREQQPHRRRARPLVESCQRIGHSRPTLRHKKQKK